MSRRGAVVALALVAYLGLLVELVRIFGGVPAARDVLVLVVLGALAVVAVVRGGARRLLAGVAVDWLPFVLALWLYDLIRGWADGAWLPAHYGDQIAIDRVLGLGSVPTVWLQEHLYHGIEALRWYDYASWFVYMTYFFGTTVLLGFLWWRDRRAFRRVAAVVVLLALAGCATFVLYPAAPPWLASDQGLLPPLSRIVWKVNGEIGVLSFQDAWERGNEYANLVAAMPSLHASYTFLVSLVLWRRARTRWRHLLWLYPAAMAFALVYLGEHYLCDVLAGFAYCVVVYAAVERASRVRERRRLAARGAAALEPETA